MLGGISSIKISDLSSILQSDERNYISVETLEEYPLVYTEASDENPG